MSPPQEVIDEKFFPDFRDKVAGLMKSLYYVKAILIDHEARIYWALMERRS